MLFKGCGRDLCDLHCRKFDVYKRGKRNDRIVMRQYLADYCCYDCYPDYLLAQKQKDSFTGCIGWFLCILLLVVATIIFIIAVQIQGNREKKTQESLFGLLKGIL